MMLDERKDPPREEQTIDIRVNRPASARGIQNSITGSTCETPKFMPENLFKSSGLKANLKHDSSYERFRSIQVESQGQGSNIPLAQDSSKPMPVPAHVRKPHNTISHLSDVNEEPQVLSYRDEPSINHIESRKHSQISVEQCLLCFKTQDRLNRVVNQLVPTDNLPKERSLDESIEILSHFVETLLAKDKDVELARQKVTQDVEKLIQNQESFERRVTEMDSVYTMLMTEQKKLKDKKKQLDSIVNEHLNLPAMRQEIAAIKAENDHLRKEVRNAVDQEVRHMFATKYKNADQLYDYPRQIDDNCFKKKPALTQADLQSVEQIRMREAELGDKEKELCNWETRLFQKSLQIEESVEQQNQKLVRMANQKQEIQENIRKLQSLTQDYQKVIEAEERTKQAQDALDRQRQQLRQEEQLIDMKISQVDKDRRQLTTDLLDQKKVQEQVRQIQDRVDMEREDHLSWFAREKTYIDNERYQNLLFREDIMKQKHQWTDAIEAKHSQLNRQNEEKLQQINMMEIAIRQQLSEVRLKEDKLQQREAELRQLKESQRREYEEHKEAIMQERKWLESVRDDVDVKMEFNSKKSTSRTRAKKSKTLATDMPRQMPLTKKPSNQSNCTSIDNKFASQMPDREQKRQNRLEIANDLEENFLSGQNRITTSPSLIQPVSTKNFQSDLSADQANQLDMLFQNDFQSNVGVFGRKSDRLLKSPMMDELNSHRSSMMDFKNDPISSIMGQDDPFMDPHSQAVNETLYTDNQPPTFREHTPNAAESSICQVVEANRNQGAFFSLTEHQADSRKEDNSKTSGERHQQVPTLDIGKATNIIEPLMHHDSHPKQSYELELGDPLAQSDNNEQELLFQFKTGSDGEEEEHQL